MRPSWENTSLRTFCKLEKPHKYLFLYICPSNINLTINMPSKKLKDNTCKKMLFIIPVIKMKDYINNCAHIVNICR